MKLHFEPNLDYQLQAIDAVCDLFRGQEICRTHFTVTQGAGDAYEKRLVKQIEVAAATIADAHNRPFIRLISVARKRGTVSARVELDVLKAGRVRRREVTVLDGDNLGQTTGRAVYADDRRPIPINKQVFLSPEFKALWNRIKHKTTYRVQCDNQQFIQSCIKGLQEAPARYVVAVEAGDILGRACPPGSNPRTFALRD